MAAEIIFDNGKIVLVKPDREITKEQLMQKIRNLKKHRANVKAKRDGLTARLQEIQSTITAYEDVMTQAGGP
jgi:hypothetical protein